MKKLLFAMLFGMTMVACSTGQTKDASQTDSTTVDSTVVDSALVDSVDSVAL